MKNSLLHPGRESTPANHPSLIRPQWGMTIPLLLLVLILFSLPPPAVGISTERREASVEASVQTSDSEGGRASVASPAGYFNDSQSFIVRGRGQITIEEEIRLSGSFGLVYTVQPDGSLEISRLYARLRDTDIVSSFLGFETDRIKIRCGSAGNIGSIVGIVNPPMRGEIRISPGAAKVSGTAFSQRGTDGGCPGRGEVRGVTATNNAPITGNHDPDNNQFSLEGSFVARVDDDDVSIVLHMTGMYVNRPPVARIGVTGRGVPLAQGGCPPLMGVNPPTTEANDPEGLRLSLLSLSFDPDGPRSMPSRADIASEVWYEGSSTGPFNPLGEGQLLGPVLFDFGPHRLALVVTDRAGASTTANCEFTVADTTPPVVTPPPRLTIPCSEPGGASARTSTLLRKFLISAKARDNSDPAPVPLSPQIIMKKGDPPVDITESTLFPEDDRNPFDPASVTQVLFRFQDRHGNIGSAISGVRVLPCPVSPPMLTVQLEPNRLQETGDYVTIQAIITADADAQIFLESITWDGKSLGDVQGADIGTDDREFMILANAIYIPSDPPQYLDQTYTVTYVAVNPGGVETRVSATVEVFSGPQKARRGL